MSPRARMTLPPELECMTRQGMETVIREANLGQEDAQIAKLYYMDKLPQVDIATELYLGRATVQRRLPGILQRMEQTARILN